MTHTRIAFLTLVVLGCALCFAADNPAVGKWNCTSDDGHGAFLTWSLLISESGGKLSGSIQMSDIMPLIDPKLEGKTLTFKTIVNPNCTINYNVTIEGPEFEGTFECPEVSGTLKGTKQS
jgi:hypothetical protein